jgi:16S rRNA C967 or C1407 C5-methylase (RsmB/RsmF family)
MCAAPGSKTFQLLEALHAGEGEGIEPSGFVVANDADAARCNLLTHQTKRMCSPCLLISNHDATRFPTLSHGGGGGVLFDRILCDVPCRCARGGAVGGARGWVLWCWGERGRGRVAALTGPGKAPGRN